MAWASVQNPEHNTRFYQDIQDSLIEYIDSNGQHD